MNSDTRDYFVIFQMMSIQKALANTGLSKVRPWWYSRRICDCWGWAIIGDAPRLKSSWQMTARWPLYCTSVFTVGDQTFAQHIHFYTYCRRPYILNWNISYIIHVRLNETFTNKLQCSHYHRQLDLHLLVEDNWLLKHCDRAVAGD